MSVYNRIELEADYSSHDSQRQKILTDLEGIVSGTGASLEGNSFYYHGTLNLYPQLFTKQLNLYWCGKQAATRLCEIGFNAGHSAMLLLLGRGDVPLDFTIFDIGHHVYTRPTLQYIESQFPHVKMEYIEGNSITTMPHWISNNPSAVGTYDVVHVDGGHSDECIHNDMINADRLTRIGGIIIVDDSHCYNIKNVITYYLSSGRYTEVDVLHTIGYQHRVIRKISD